MKSIFRRPKNTNNNGNFVVMNTSFDTTNKVTEDMENLHVDGTIVSGNDDLSFLDEEGKTASLPDDSSVPNDTPMNHDPASEQANLTRENLDANKKSFQERDDEDDDMVEVVQSDKGNSVILGDEEEILVEKSAAAAAAPPSSRFGWLLAGRRGGGGGGGGDGAPTRAAGKLPRRSFWSRKERTVDETPRAGWTNREKVLLWITLFNTILIIVLLGNNAALVAERNQTASTSFSAATDGCGEITPPDVDATPPSEWKPAPWDPSTGNSGSGGGGENVPAPSPPVDNTTVAVGDPSARCGCAACVEATWNSLAGEFTCGERIMFLKTDMAKQYPTEVQACRQVAFEFPCICGGCDPGRCKLPTPEFSLPSGWTPPTVSKSGGPVTPSPTPAAVTIDTSLRAEDQPMYCFPDAAARPTYTLWNGLVIQPKVSEAACGPGNNFFRSETVVVDTAQQTLTMLYANGVASEVRILLPEAQRPFSYGSYQFSVKSVEVLNSAGDLLSNVLPKELVLGLFTWDPFESYASHENYNHEVDIEISRWNCESNSDLQYLVQPPGLPQMHRLFTGDPSSTDINTTYKQGGQKYRFDWNPARIDWISSAGEQGVNNGFILKTEEAVYRDVRDYVQCLPDRGGNTEVRINLWNSLGAAYPVGLSATDVVKVVFDSFIYVPSDQTHVPTGGICSKHCQCEAGVAQCINSICTVTA